MILQMYPDQVAEAWPYLEPVFVNVLPEAYRSESSAVSMLRAILMEDCQVWQITSDDEAKTILGYGITEIRHDKIVDVRHLFLYLLVAENIMSVDMWKNALRTLKAYARSKACSSIQAVTIIEEVNRLASMLGGTTNQTLIEFGVI